MRATENDLNIANDEINLYDYWRILKKRTKRILWFVGVVSVIAVVVSLLLPKTYQSQAVLLPISSMPGQGGVGGLDKKLGGLGSILGMLAETGGGGSAKTFLAILKSRSISEKIINDLDLKPQLFPRRWDKKANAWRSANEGDQPTMEDAVRRMQQKHMTFVEDRKLPVVRVTGIFGDPQLAARVVNAYVTKLQQFISANTLTMAKRNRIFTEDQLAESRIDLLKAGKNLARFYQKYKVSSANSNLTIDLDDLRPQGPDADQGAGLASKTAAPKAETIPHQVFYNYLNTQSQVLTNINSLLATQYELAKIEEAKQGLAFQVVDHAVPPHRRHSPKRALICVIAFFAACFFGVIYAFVAEYLERMRYADRAQQAA